MNVEQITDFDCFMDTLIEENPDVPFFEGDLELFSSLLPELDAEHDNKHAAHPSALSSEGKGCPGVSWAQVSPLPERQQMGTQQSQPHQVLSTACLPLPAHSLSPAESTYTEALPRDDFPAAHAHYEAGVQPLQRTGSWDCGQLRGADGRPSMRKPPKGKKPSSAASLAQKKYMERQKMKMASSEQQVAELTRSLDLLMREKKELELKERIMRSSLEGLSLHLDHLFADKVVREFQQLSLIQMKAILQSLVEGREIPVEEAKNWTVEDYVCFHFERYLERLRDLLPEACRNASSAAAQLVHQLVTMHGDHDRPGALASCFHWALFCWNHEEAQKRSSQGTPDWVAILEEAQLTEDQTSKLLAARQILLLKMTEITSARRDIFSQLGLEMLALPQDEMHKCPAAMLLYNNLRQEQTSVLGFILNVDTALTSLQQAILDVRSAPWCPNLLHLTDILARQRGAREPVSEPRFPWLRPKGETLVMPYATPFEVLTMPLTGMGCGKHLRLGVVMCPSWTVLSTLCCPFVSQRRSNPLSLLAVCSGNRWRVYTSYTWLIEVRRCGKLIQNPLIEE